jgi:hypothetical protein
MHIRIYDHHCSLHEFISMIGNLACCPAESELTYALVTVNSLNTSSGVVERRDMHIQIIKYLTQANLVGPSLGAYSSASVHPFNHNIRPLASPYSPSRAGKRVIRREKWTHHQRTCSSLLMVVLRPYHLLPWLKTLDIQVGNWYQLRLVCTS